MGEPSLGKCAVYGAGGHGKVVAEIAGLVGYSEVHFYDDRWPELTKLEHWSVVGNMDTLVGQADRYSNIVVAIGNNASRMKHYHLLRREGVHCKPLIHPKAVVSQHAKIGNGTVIMAGSVVNSFCQVGTACIINTSAIVEHDCILSDGVHICPGAKLAGGVSIASESWLGIGCNVIQSIKIGSNVVVGAGTTVIRNITDHQTVVGNPAKRICR